MADNGQIDNIYIDFEVKDNSAEQKITAIDTALEKLETTLENIDTSNIDKALEKESIISREYEASLQNLDMEKREKENQEEITTKSRNELQNKNI